MRRTNIYLDDRQCERLDRAARAEGISRAELVRRVLDQWIGTTTGDEAADLAAIDAAFGVLADAPDVERGRDARGEHLAALWRRA